MIRINLKKRNVGKLSGVLEQQLITQLKAFIISKYVIII